MLIVGKDVKYAQSGGTVNAALTPDMLDAGSIGIYTTGSDGKVRLVIKGTAGAGQIASTAITANDTLTMYSGLGSGNQYRAEAIEVRGIKKILGSKYRAGSAEVIKIGWNGTDGDLLVNLLSPTNIVDTSLLYRQEADINFKVRGKGNNEFGNLHYITIPILPTDTAQTILQKLVAQTNQVQPYDTKQYFTATLSGVALPPPVQAALATATTGGTIAASTAVFVKVFAKTSDLTGQGSNEQTIIVGSGTSTNTVTATWANVPGNSGYRVFIGGTTGVYTKYFDVAADVTTLVYTGAAGTAGVPTTQTAGGLILTAIDPTLEYTVSLFGVIDQSKVVTTGFKPASGSPAQLLEIEADSMAYRGDLYPLSVMNKRLTSQVDTNKTYDTYEFIAENTTPEKTGNGYPTRQPIDVIVAFEVQGNVLDTNQHTNFEQIWTDIFPATTQISS